MAKWNPCKRRDFIRKLKKLGFDSPEPGGRHYYMRYGTYTIIVIVILAAIGSVIHALNLLNIYRSETTVIPRAEEKTAVAPFSMLHAPY